MGSTAKRQLVTQGSERTGENTSELITKTVTQKLLCAAVSLYEIYITNSTYPKQNFEFFIKLFSASWFLTQSTLCAINESCVTCPRDCLNLFFQNLVVTNTDTIVLDYCCNIVNVWTDFVYELIKLDLVDLLVLFTKKLVLTEAIVSLL